MKTPSAHRLARRTGTLAARIFAGSIATLIATHSATAADGTWTHDGSSPWDTESNWSDLTVAGGSDFTANFNLVNLTEDRTVSLDSDRIIGNLIFGDTATGSAGGWILSGGSGPYILTLDGTTPTVTVNSLGTGKIVTISAELFGTAGLARSGAGSLTLSAANTYTGPTTIKAGNTLVTGSLNGNTGTALTFSGSGTFNVSEASNVSQGMGELTFSAGDGTVQSTNNGGTSSLAFDSLATRATGATGNFVLSGGTPGNPGTPGTNNIVFSTAPAAGQSIDRGLFYNGSSYAAYDSGGFVRALMYGSDTNADTSLSGAQTDLGTIDATKDVQYLGSANTTTTSDIASASNTTTLPVTDGTLFKIGQAITGANIKALTFITNISVNSLTLSQTTNGIVAAGTTLTPYNSVSAQPSGSLNTLNLSGAGASLTLGSGATLSVNGILRSDGTSGVVGAIMGGTAIRPVTSGGELVIRTDAATDTMEIRSVIQNNVNPSSLTKTGAGTLTLRASNTYTGGTTVTGGTLSVGSSFNAVNNRTITLDGGTLTADSGAVAGNPPALIIGPGGGTRAYTGKWWVQHGWTNDISGTGNFYFYGGAGQDERMERSAGYSLSGDFVIMSSSGGWISALPNGTLDLAGGAWSLNTNATTPMLGGLKGANNLNCGGLNVQIGNNNKSTIYSGALGNGGLTKIGTGTLTLAGTNSYTGATIVSAGRLALAAAGSITTSSGVTLKTAAVLDTTAKASFAIPAAKTHTFHLSGMNSGSSGRLVAAGLNIDSATVAFVEDTPLDDAAYVLAEYSSLTGTNNTFASVTPPVGYTIDYNYNGATQIALVSSGGSAYDTWATSFTSPPLSNTAADADPDNDGRNNLTEFAFNGDPRFGSDNAKVFVLFADSNYAGDPSSDKELILTVAVRSGTPAFSAATSPTATKDGITYTIEGSTTLANFPTKVNVVPTPVTTGLPAAGSGYEYRSFSLDGSNGLPAAGFLRAKVTQP